ncbi:hypothetical protein FB451DRAFT_1124420 [Mycena latifolia]|nr:hypothetical protein FB451DRAFT_1124420 [Mycena latifolia]
MEVDTEQNAPQRRQELWFEDGNLVIQAGNSQFRVYRGTLAARSAVFQDMLSFPQPPDSELVEGCPLVRLQDAEIEVSEFLKAIFVPEYFPPFPYRTKFDVLVGCLRLSHKYEVDYLRRRALVHLSSAYRTTLSEWDSSLDFGGNTNLTRGRTSDVVSCSFPIGIAAKISVVQLAREVEALWVLPLAFYLLSFSFRDIGRALLEENVYQDRPTALCPQDRASLLSGYQIQLNSSTADILRFLSHPLEIEGCLTPTQCATRRLAAVESSREMIREYPSAPINIWNEDDWELLDNVCPACLAMLQQTHKDARQAFWNKLPGIYDLPPWEELEKMKVAAIGSNLLPSHTP